MCCTCGCWGSLMIPIWGHPWLSLNNHSDWERCLSRGAKQMTLLSPGRAGMKMQGTISWSASPRSLSDDGTTARPGNHFQTCERQEGDKESRAWIKTGGGHVWPIWWLSTAEWLAWEGKGKQWVSLKSPQGNQKLWAGWGGSEIDGKLSECWPRGCWSVTSILGGGQLL